MTKNLVICAIDVNDYDQEVVDVAAGYAQHFGVDLDLVHVTLFPDPTNAAWPAYVGSPNSMIADNRRLKTVETNVAGVELHFHHLSGTPSKQILGFIDRKQPQLLVMGTHGRRGLAQLLGSTASHVLRHASCPVLILRQRQADSQLADAKSGPT